MRVSSTLTPESPYAWCSTKGEQHSLGSNASRETYAVLGAVLSVDMTLLQCCRINHQ